MRAACPPQNVKSDDFWHLDCLDQSFIQSWFINLKLSFSNLIEFLQCGTWVWSALWNHEYPWSLCLISVRRLKNQRALHKNWQHPTYLHEIVEFFSTWAMSRGQLIFLVLDYHDSPTSNGNIEIASKIVWCYQVK